MTRQFKPQTSKKPKEQQRHPVTLPGGARVTALTPTEAPSLVIGIEKAMYREATTGRFVAKAETAHLKQLSDEGFSRDEIHKLVAPRRTLERRIEKKQPLSEVEADRVMRLQRIHAHAVRVFGSADKAHRWLRKPCRALDGAVPIDLLASETGAHIVEDELHAIDHGMFV